MGWMGGVVHVDATCVPGTMTSRTFSMLHDVYEEHSWEWCG